MTCFYCNKKVPNIGQDYWGDPICQECNARYYKPGWETGQDRHRIELPWYLKIRYDIDKAEQGIIVKYSPLPSIQPFHQSSAYNRCIIGPRGSTKTSSALIEKLLIAQRNFPRFRHFKFLIVRRTYRELKDSTQATFFKLFPKDEVNCIYRGGEEETASLILQGANPGVVDFIFRSAQEPEDVGKFLSGEYTGVLIDEAVQVPRMVRDGLVGCLRYPEGFPPKDYHIDLISNPPDSEEHWIYQCFYPESRKKLPNHALFLNTPFENKPMLRNDPNYYNKLCEAMPPDMAEIYVYGKVGYIQKGDPFYPWFAKDLHVFDKTQEKLSPYGTILRGLDFGLGKSVCLYCYEDERGNIDILDEIVVSDRGGTKRLAQMAILLKNRCYRDFLFEDFADIAGKNYTSASPDTSDFDILTKYGIIPRGRQSQYKERRNILYHFLTTIDPELKRPKLRVDKSCVNIIRGFLGGYRQPKQKDRTTTQKVMPVKEGHYEHFFNALEYILVGRYGMDDQAELPLRGKRRDTYDSGEDWFGEMEPVENQWGYLGR